MTLKHSLPLLALSLTLTGCGVYKKYQRPTVDTSVYRGNKIDTLSQDTTSFGQTPWRALFTDAPLQALIEKALQQNVAEGAGGRIGATSSRNITHGQILSERKPVKPDRSYFVTFSRGLGGVGGLRAARERVIETTRE